MNLSQIVVESSNAGATDDLYSDVTIGILAALPVEGAAMATLVSEARPTHFPDDPNDYLVGYLASVDPARPHRVALTVMAEDNTRNAAAACTDMLRSFPNIRCVVMTGVAGGVPCPDDPGRHVRLGDVIVAIDGIVDYGHTRHGAATVRLRRPVAGMSPELVRAARALQARLHTDDIPWERLFTPAASGHPMATFARPRDATDRLHLAGHRVAHPARTRSGHAKGWPKLHFGMVGSADVLLTDERRRDELAAQHGVIAFEMEGAGVAASVASRGLGWFMVRGIVDYCNEQRDWVWHPYASLSAAAGVRVLLASCRPFPVWRTEPVGGVIALLPDTEADELLALLERADDVDGREVWQAATDGLIVLPEVAAGLGELARRLATLNASANRMPPALAFAEHVAARVEHRLRAELHAWSDRAAERLHLGDLVRRYRASITLSARAHEADGATPRIKPCILIQIERDGIDRERCQLRYWIQRRTDRWDPEPSSPQSAAFAQVEAVMQEAIRHAESVWHDNHEGPVEVELLLPVDLLHAAVEWWRTELESPDPTPLCLDYPVVVRSLDRMRARHRQRIWNNRWQALWRNPPGHRVLWGRVESQVTDLGQWNARLRDDQHVTTVVLSASPDERAGYEELQSALNAGIPVILWDRRPQLEPEVGRMLRTFTGGQPTALIHHIGSLRSEAAMLPATEQSRHHGRHLSLLWDDPTRNPIEGNRT